MNLSKLLGATLQRMQCVFWRVAIKPLIKERSDMQGDGILCAKVTTQILEQYGSEKEPLWKPKGGETYVFVDTGPRIHNASVAILDRWGDGAICREFPIEITELSISEVDKYRTPDGCMTQEDYDDPYCVDYVGPLWVYAAETKKMQSDMEKG